VSKKKKRSKEANPASSKESVTDSSSEMDAVDASPGKVNSVAAAKPAVSDSAAKPGAPLDFDAATRDKFASTFRPAWQVAEDSAATAKPAQEALRQEHALSGEISLDAIPLPPLPTSTPKRHVIAVVVVILLIVIAGILVSQRSQPDEVAAPPPSSDR